MQSARRQADEKKAKLNRSYQELLDEFSNKDLKTVGNYQLGRLIGKGSFGKVVLKSAKKDDSNLAREIHHHRQFVHPHIARLYEVVVTENLVWMVMEYCSGEELYDYLLRHGKLPVDKVQKSFTQLVGAVAYVHQQNCVHRDLKLENILLDKNENVKLLDFGFAREYEGKTNYLQTFCGTICYSAPEMLKGEKYAGEKVDVWSLGIILYALLCGELPFDDDDDDTTRRKILGEEPNYPDHIPPDALSLLKQLLSKRPFPRPALSDILNHPFLSEYAPEQRAILSKDRLEPFSSAVERDCLHRMKSAGVNIDHVIESVLAQKCDTLAGWWTLLLEKEERKQKRRERKRKEKETDRRASRRFSQASSRLERLAPVGEEGSFVKLGDAPLPRPRGRSERRSGYYPEFQITDLPGLPEAGKSNATLSPDTDNPPPPIDKDSIRSVSTSRNRRPIPPPKEGVPGVLRSARSRGSTLHLVTTSDALAGGRGSSRGLDSDTTPQQKVRKRPSQGIMAHWKNLTNWLVESTRRHKHNHRNQSHSTPDLRAKSRAGKEGKLSKENSPRPHTGKNLPTHSPQATVSQLPQNLVVNGFTRKPVGSSGQQTASAISSPSTPGGFSSSGGPSVHRRVPTGHSYKRQSLSPSPITPRSAVRRPSAGLRGRKSTSSSVSSVRSMHHAQHYHTHSKASSTSSANSVSTNMSKTPMQTGRSPHHSVKVLPATPTSTTHFPSNIRLVRGAGPPLALYNEAAPSSGASRSGGRLAASPMIPPAPGSPNPFASFGERSMPFFAKRKRNVFKGPSTAFGGGSGNRSASGSNHGSTPSHSRSASSDRMGGGRRSGEIAAVQEEDEEALGMAHDMLEEDEDEDEDDRDTVKFRSLAEEDEDVEEVESFTPVVRGPGEKVEERIFEPGELEKVQNGAAKEHEDEMAAVGHGALPWTGTTTAVS
ncbi:MAP/microtubule affinity-regulating kinase [Diaporthe helianthi]|uniref:MAP/microtubule affinity-regulating kinase n=1 Tax=Diaporthe helianthi TaxID=158607 RepID=A0A2P5HNQ0_DIAHE|nr:MAP/microtubule affinity-regulating kinase [Diaporthe helianthi]